MDWSLVLVSQGIETAIDYDDDSAGWQLIVAEQDHEPAMAAIRHYRLENRRRPWRRDVFGAGILFDWGSLAWVFLVGLFYWLSTIADFRTAGSMDAAAVTGGQWWRLFTATWLHADAGHLAANATIGLVLLGLVMARYGTGAGLLAACLAGAGGNVAAWFLSRGPHHSLGASGMVLGCLGLLAVQSFSMWQQTPRAAKHVVGGVVGGLMLFVLLGLTPGTDVLAHFGGFCTGLALGAALAPIRGLPRKTGVNLLCGFLFALLVILPWVLALRSAGAFTR